MFRRLGTNFLRFTANQSYSTATRKILVLADHNNATLTPSTLSVVTAANKIGGEVMVLVAGKGANGVCEAAKSVAGVNKVLHADGDRFAHFMPEALTALVAGLHQAHKFSHILGSSSSVAKSALPRVAAKLDVSMVSEVIEVKAVDTFKRPTYAGNIIATVQSKDPVVVLSVRPTAFEKSAASGGAASVAAVPADAAGGSGSANEAQFVSAVTKKSDRPELATAKIVVAGGRALKDAATFSSTLEPLANKLNAAIGASRAAVDANYCANDLQIGQTGKIIAPELYIGLGISGAIQHLAGMKDSKVIVAINKDPDAPIFAVADLGLVADLFVAVPEMVKKL